jgi:pimeloyl-ACP methyl ester carboxylesterase
MGIVFAAVVVVVAVYGVYAVASRVVPGVMFPGGRAVGAAPAGAEVVVVDAADGTPLEALLVRGAGVSSAAPGPAVLFAHGNGEVADDWVDAFADVVAAGVSVVVVEYRGYGRVAGVAEAAVVVDDAARVRAWLLAQPFVDAGRVSLWGRSIGSGVVCALARQAPPAALILESSYQSLAPLVHRFGLPGVVLGVGVFDNAAVVAALPPRVPVVIAHGTHDALFPVAGARALATRPGAVLVELAAGHNDVPRAPIVAAALRAL